MVQRPAMPMPMTIAKTATSDPTCTSIEHGPRPRRYPLGRGVRDRPADRGTGSMDPDIRSQFSPEPGVTYLQFAPTYGLPPEADDPDDAGPPWMRLAGRQPRTGSPIGTVRPSWRAPLFAALVGTTSDRVALLPAVSVGVGYVAARLGPTDEVVVPAHEFTSVLFPLLLGARARRDGPRGALRAPWPTRTAPARRWWRWA